MYSGPQGPQIDSGTVPNTCLVGIYFSIYLGVSLSIDIGIYIFLYYYIMFSDGEKTLLFQCQCMKDMNPLIQSK